MRREKDKYCTSQAPEANGEVDPRRARNQTVKSAGGEEEGLGK